MLAVFDVHFTTLVCKNYSSFPVLCPGPEQTFPVLLIFLAKHRKVKYGQLPQKDITLVRWVVNLDSNWVQLNTTKYNWHDLTILYILNTFIRWLISYNNQPCHWIKLTILRKLFSGLGKRKFNYWISQLFGWARVVDYVHIDKSIVYVSVS